MTTTTTSQTIRRDRACGCGCKGSDSWHRRTFKRVVRNVETIEGVDLTGTGRFRFVDVMRGTIKTPWGEQVVYAQIIVFPCGKQRAHGWHFDA